ncbi:protein kinase-like domain, concanavalin A-like lectin/glucanase domain protein, partial [Tanacetum coccineum]
ENPIRTLGDYSKPSHEGYRNTIELHVGNNVVPLRLDTIRLVQNKCSFHGLRSEDPNQHLKDFLKLMDSLDLNGENRERTRLRLFQFSLRDQASNWLECIPAGSITTWEDLTTHFLAQFFPPGRTAKLRNDILMFQQNYGESLSEGWTRFKDFLQKVPHHGIDLWLQVQIFYDHVNPATRRTINQSAGGKLRDRNAKESWALLEDLALYDNKSWNDPRDLAKSVKAIALPQDVPSTSDRRLIDGPHDTQYCMEDPKQAFVEYASLRTDVAGGALPSDTVKTPKLNVNTTTSVLSARSYPTEDPQCSTHTHGSINTIVIHPKQQNDSRDGMAEEEEQEREGSNKDDEGIEWLDVKEPLDLVDTSEESVYESLIKEMPKCSLNYDFRIKKGNPRNLKIPCMICHKFTANAYIDVDLPMNIMSLAYYNSIRKNGYEYKGRNFVGLGRDMHVFVSYIVDFTILENIKTNIDPSLSHMIFGRPFIEISYLAINRKHGLMTFIDETKEITFKTPYKDPEKSELSSEGHDLLSSRVILSEDDYDKGCRKPSDLEDEFYKDTIKLGPEYLTGMDDEGEVT